MLNKSHHQLIITIGVLCIFLILPVTAQINNNDTIVNELKNIDKNFPQYANYASIKEYVENHISTLSENYISEIKVQSPQVKPSPENIFDHPWPMQGYNREHLGRSPYGTASNPGIEKWRFSASDWCDGSPAIANDGTVYFGDASGDFYAIYPDGNLKWRFTAARGLGDFGSSPAIAPDGVIYIGTAFGSYIEAVNPNGTEKWRCLTPEVDTSITIDEDGVIYFGHHQGVDARYSNGTLKWRFLTDDFVQSTPAVDDDGIVYFGSHDHYIYAVYPNGTLKWKFLTGSWVHGSPTIGADGTTIYCGSDEGYLYALYQNGTMKWRVMVGGMRASPSLDKDGNLYFGVWDSRITSVSPNGTIRWVFPLRSGDGVWGSTAAISDDGTVYIGNNIDIDMLGGGEILALDLNGTLKWRKIISNQLVRSSAVIGSDGTVYICSSSSGQCDIWGHLHVFGPVVSNIPPNTPSITGPIEAHVRESIAIYFSATDDDLNPISYYVDWGDGQTYNWTGDFGSGETIYGYHKWLLQGSYTIKVKARDTLGAESNWGTFKIRVPIRNNLFDETFFQLIERFLENHPYAFPILRQLLAQ